MREDDTFLRSRLAECLVSGEVDAFLSQPDLALTTRGKYRQTLAVVEDELGDAPVTGACLAGIVAQRWHHASPATWNRRLLPRLIACRRAGPVFACYRRILFRCSSRAQTIAALGSGGGEEIPAHVAR